MKKILVTALLATGLVPLVRQDSSASHAGASPDGSAEVLELLARSSHPLILEGDPQDVYVHVALAAAELPALPRPAMNLALVIDRSGSMGSEDKLTHAKSAAEQLVGRLREGDRLAVVAYDDEIATLVPSAPVGDRRVFLEAIRGLTSGGSTDLYGGVTAGCEEVLRHVDRERLNRVVLLSDGLPTVGITAPDEIRAQAARFRERGVHISTMGMGLSYDDVLLRGIAARAGGKYYYVRTAESVGDHLDHEIDQLTRIVGGEIEVRLALGNGVEAWEVIGAPHRFEAGEVVVALEDLASGAQDKFVVRLRVQAKTQVAGAAQPLVTATLRYLDRTSNEARIVHAPPLSCATTDSAEAVELSRNLDVLVQAEIVHNARALLSAMDLQRAGGFDAARELLENRYRNSKLLNDTEYKSSELTRMLMGIRQTLLDLERTASDTRASRDFQLSTDLLGLGYLGY